MFTKLILISTMIGFVYMRSTDIREVQHLSLSDDLHHDTIMDAESTVTEEQRILQILTTTPSMDLPLTSHDSMHPGPKHPKKRATNHKEERQTDLRPGCCG